MTISPKLMGELKQSSVAVERKLSPRMFVNAQIERLELDEKKFRWLMNQDPMATEKLAEGIRLFHADALKLAKLIEARL